MSAAGARANGTAVPKFYNVSKQTAVETLITAGESPKTARLDGHLIEP
ncbi:hypothetical protein [Nesterenkonia sp. F]|nr:hypothetical protein [Nesterenkonia sp. F]